MTRVAVVGATGYAGAELVRLLAGHPHIELTVLTSRKYAGQTFESVYPAMSGVVRLTCEAYDSRRVCEQADVVFTALPHKLPMEIVPGLIDQGKRVIDLSADFRFQDAAPYEAHYQPHTAKDLLSRSVYGLPEIYPDEIRAAVLVGNPGCYPTSVLLPLVPLVRDGLLDLKTVVADAKSGVSGAGRSPSLTTLFCAVSESFKAYKVAGHRHTPEMEAVLGREAGQAVTLTFVPHLVPMSRGMQTTIYANPVAGVEREHIDHCLRTFYRDRPFVRLRGDGKPPDTLFVRGTNYCDIGFVFDGRNNRLILLSAIDNLIKGAAGQALQNMNIMLDFPETAGLMQVPSAL
ncbi:MAG: N-acetyl-gamma-glutamyl-phosphate reductase [Desulfobacterales bacterium]|jgi:N-acetyl-gamma-glutamyl-phosphate reductase